MAWDWQGTAFDWMPDDNYSGDWGNYVQAPENQQGWTFDNSWDDSLDYEFFSPTGEYGQDAASQYGGAGEIPDYLQVDQYVEPPVTPEQPSSSNEWFSGLKDFAKSDLGGRVISGGITGLGSFITNAMNQSAQSRREEEARKFKERMAESDWKHRKELASMKGGGGGGAGPATTQATTSSLDQNIIKAR